MRKKFTCLLLAVVASCSLILSACGSSGNNGGTSGNEASNANQPAAGNEQADKKVTMNFVYAGGDPATKQAISDAVNAFTKTHPNITINQEPSGSGPYADFLKTKDAVGEFPDFLEMRDTQIYADAGKLAELPSDLVELIDNAPKVNDKYYVLPFTSVAPNGIIYSKALFEKAGITAEPKTYDEFLADTQKIKDLGVSPIVIGGKDVWHMGFWVNKYLMDQVFIQNPDWNAQRSAGKVSFTDANVVSAMKDFTELFDKGFVDKGWLSTADNQTASLLTSGKAAMLYSGPWMFPTIAEADPSFEFDFFPLPDREGNLIVNGLLSPQGLSLSAEAAKDPDKAAAFSEFVKFFFSPEQYGNYLKSANAIPSTKEKVTYEASPQLQKVIDLMADPNVKKSATINGFWGENQIPPQFRDWFYKLAQQWVSTGKPSVEDAMKMADEEWDKEVKAKNQT
ncbi:ABC transporter substrate-binding protein [Paenibacillus sepulcri]|uniref:ABC transporter substrate-binding protein n=1 Tax=Paenibacillus sepulcri TaxID=359917 RepID=A0ABS7BY09_9BACL|nr:ABC transporter substrate-binding protein [Paenibacillus sepulcri]